MTSRPIAWSVAAGCLLAGVLEASNDGLLLGPWREVEPLPRGVWMHAMVTVGDHLYVIGGRAGPGWRTVKAQVCHARIRKDGTLEAWRQTAPLPQALGGHVAMAVGRRIYVVSGRGHGSDNIMKTPVTFVGTATSDGGISGWRTGPGLPKDAGYRGAGTVCDGRLYYVGGFYRRQAYRADIQASGRLAEWRADQNLIPTRMYFGLVSHASRLYAIGGNPTSHYAEPADTVYGARVQADGALERWRRTAPLPAPASQFSAAKVGDTVFIIGGSNRDQVRCARVRPDGELAHWRLDRPFPYPVALGAAVAHGNRLYHSGGCLERDGGKWTVSRRAHLTEVRLPIRYPIRFRVGSAIVQSFGWLQLRRRYVQKGNDPIAIEAEHATSVRLASSDMAPLVVREASGRRCVRYAHELMNVFVVKRPGAYRTWLRVHFPASGNWNHLEQMDAGPTRQILDAPYGPAKVWAWLQGPRYELSDGEHTHRFPSPAACGGGALLDKIVLSPIDSPAPTGKGPAPSVVETCPRGQVTSNRFRLDELTAWRLECDKEACGGRIAIEYSYDRGKTWSSTPEGKLMPVVPSIERLTFRLTLVAGPDGSTPRVRALALVGYPRT